MFLKRLEISGFKSFAGKTVLQLEPGITAIVGPNGSGKSNLSDAIRWALTEQGKNQLRLKKSEELIFAGTEKQSRSSMAEVSLLFDNSDGQMAVDFSEVELSRLLYRSGESTYQLNRRKVRLQEVQQILTASGFGPNSYAVIAQGTIDSFILATPSERKLLFEEASGIRQFEVRREQAIRKLESTEANLARVRDVLSELEPRLKDLERSVSAAQERLGLEQQLQELRAALISSAETALPREIKALAGKLKLHEADIKRLEHQTAELMNRQAQITQDQKQFAQRQQAQSRQLSAAESERDQLSNGLSVKRAELQYLSEKQTAAVDLDNQLAELKDSETLIRHQLASVAKSLKNAQAAEAAGQAALKAATAEVGTAQNKLSQLRRRLDENSRQEYTKHALGILKQLARRLDEGGLTPDELRLMVHKAGRLLGHATTGSAELIAELKGMQLSLISLMKKRDQKQEACSKATLQVRSLELDSAHLNKQLDQLVERQAEAASALKQLSIPNPRIIANRRQEVAQMEQKLKALTKRLTLLRDQQSSVTPAADPKVVFELAAELEASKTDHGLARQMRERVSAELSVLSGRLADYRSKKQQWQVRLNAASSERNLADLEREIELTEAKLSGHVKADQEVLEEHSEVSQRHEFLSSQLTDLEAAKRDLADIIKQLEKLIAGKFKLAFADISRQFARYFHALFDGGRADLQLKPDSTGNYGIEITAMPPGKRVQSLATLSGGERSLTGIALLSAILSVNPSPFVVLDEVDASLDEANSNRLARILTEVARKTQLLVITHNRITMQAAHSLFGVTMDEHQVSRLLSIKLQEAWTLAPRA